MKTIEEINQKYLCTGCGTCINVCSQSAIEMKLKKGQYFPEVDPEKCAKCGKCLDVCAGIEISINSIANKLWPTNKYKIELGKFIATYTGYSLDQKIRYEAASGGIVTSIVLYLLRNNIVNGAILTRMSENNPCEAESFIAYTEEEVMSAQSSKYCPTSPVKIIKNLKDKKQNEKFVFVGLPCHIHGVRKLQENEIWVQNKILLTIGIFCSHGVTLSGTEFLLDKYGKDMERLDKIQYRGKGWPGGMHIYDENGDNIFIPHNNYWPPFFANYLFTPLRCLVCHDLTSELSDISTGDAWLKEIVDKDKIGTSIIVTRSELANKIINDMKLTGEISLSAVSPQKVIESQKGILNRKKIGVGSRLKLYKILSIPVPEYDQIFKYTYRGLFGATLMYLNGLISRTKIGRKIISLIPEKYLKYNTKYVHHFGSK